MITFVQLIFEFVVFQVLINTIKGISFIFFFQKRGRVAIMNMGPGQHFYLGTPLTWRKEETKFPQPGGCYL